MLLTDLTLGFAQLFPGPFLVLEDGSIVAGANTFVGISDVTAYVNTHAGDGGADSWLTASPALQARAIVIAGEYLRNESRYYYRGTRQDVLVQRLPWPRVNATEYRGPSYPSNFIPWRMKDAQCDLAMRLIMLALVSATPLIPTALQPDLDRGGMVASERVGPISATYMKGAPPETVLQTIHGILAPILRERITDISPFQAQPQDLTPYVPGEWDYLPIDPDLGTAEADVDSDSINVPGLEEVP